MSRVCAAEGCTNILTGQQRKWCSQACCERGWRARHPDRYSEAEKRRQPAKTAWQRNRDRTAAGRAVCSTCGRLAGVGSAARSTPISACRACRTERAEARRQMIAALWHAGMSTCDIAATVETTPGSIGVELAHMRAAGWDLPYRRPQATTTPKEGR